MDLALMRTRLDRLDSAQTGRFQIVNGTPSLARTVMLLDTRTGRTWTLCEDKSDSMSTVSTHWCAMRTLGDASAP